jgi:hypothetical protein
MTANYTWVNFDDDTSCFYDQTYNNFPDNDFSSCTLTDGMVTFLNLTARTSSYIAAYCLNPP